MEKSKADYKALWALIFLILFAGIIVSASLPQNSGNRNTFSVSIGSPAGGEAWQGNTNHTISYTISGGTANYTVELFYTTDSQTFTPIHTITNQTEGEHTYLWTTPSITSNSVRIRVNITDNSSATASNISETFEIDSTEPSAVSDLSAQASSYNTITLTWTAPGENGLPCNFTDVKDEVPDLNIPDYPSTGVTSNLTVAENIIIGCVRIYLHINHTCINQLIVKLTHPEGTEATLFYMTGGTASNIWGWYERKNFMAEAGSGNPVPVDDISVFAGKSTQGTWKLFVSDNYGGYTGVIDSWKIEFSAENAVEYDIRYNSTAPIDAGNWANSTQCTNKPIPSMPGKQEMFNVTGLGSGIKYYFAIKSKDNVGLSSNISNCASATTLLYVNVISPNGNEIWSGKSSHIIKYEISGFKNLNDPYGVNIYRLYDNNTTYVGGVNHNISGTYEFNWTTPELNTTSARIRVGVATPNATGSDDSDSNFTIDSTLPYVKNATSNVSILPNEKIVLEFSDPMNSSSVESAFSSTPNFSGISWSWNDNFTIATISHANFTTGTYNCIVNTTAKDRSDPGNNIAANYTFSFSAVAPLEVRVIYPAGGEVWNGTKYQNIYYSIAGGKEPYNATLYWVNETDKSEGRIGFGDGANATTYSYAWLPSITNNTLKIRINVTDNTTPKQQRTALSAGIFEIDSTPPGKPQLKDFGSELVLEPEIIAKEGYPRAHAVKIKWLASGDDEFTGKPKYYHIKYYTEPIIESNWANITSFINYTATACGNDWESSVIGNLQPNTNYYFALKAYDNVGFVSEISNYIRIKTLKYEIWDESLVGEPGFVWDAANKTIYVISSKTISYTEVLVKGNLRIVNTAELKFDKVLLVVGCEEDFEYRIEVAPGGIVGYLEGGAFYLEYSNITASVYVMPDGKENWHPYLFFAYEKSRFWLLYSSMHHCGGKLEDVENVEIEIAQIGIELEVERGIELRSSEIIIMSSIISYSWGIFIRSSLPMAASPSIAYNTIANNRYGIIIKPKIDITEQWPINLVVNNISNNGVGVYSDSTRVGLEGCQFIRNIYGVIYNNTPLDWLHNVSGRIYHCVFENNTMAIKSTSSSLKLIATKILNNTYLDWDDEAISDEIYASVYCEDSIMEITCDGNDRSIISGNAYLNWLDSTVADTIISTIYCKNSVLNITNANISDNNGGFISGSRIINHISFESGPLDTMVSTVYHEGSSILITGTNLSNNGKPFYAENFKYVINVTYPNGTDEEELEMGSDLPGHYSAIFTRFSSLNFTNNVFCGNTEGIISLFSTLVIEHNTMTGPGWSTTGMGEIQTETTTYGLISVGSPLTFTDNEISEYYLGVLVSAEEANLTGNTFEHNVIGSVFAGSQEIPNILSLPIIVPVLQTVLDEIEEVNTIGGIYQNKFHASMEAIIAGYSVLTMVDNEIWGTGLPLGGDPYTSLIGLDISSSTLNIDKLRMWALWFDIFSVEMVEYSFGGETANTSIIGNLSVGGAILTITNSTIQGIFGIAVEYSSVTMKNCEMQITVEDTTTGCLEPLFCVNSSLTLETVTISDNFWREWDVAGFIEYYSSTVSLTDVTITNIFPQHCEDSTVTITSSSLTHNSLCIHAVESDVTVISSTISENSHGGINVEGQSSLTVTDTEISSSDKGIYTHGISLSESPTMNISESRLLENVYGIFCQPGSGRIVNNTINNNVNGIRTESGTEVEIKGNTMDGNGWGISCDFSSPDILLNDISNCRDKGICVEYSSPSIVGNTIHNAKYGIECKSYQGLKIMPNITGNKIYSCEKGIYINQYASSSITENVIYYNENGIYSEKHSSPVLEDNKILNNTAGISCIDSDSCIIINNTVSGNNYGIYLTGVTNAFINSSLISNNSYGIYASLSFLTISGTSVTHNTLSNDSYGVYLYKCPDPTLPGIVKIINSTVTSNILDLNYSSSRVECKNCTVNKIYLYDSSLACADFTPEFNNITFADNSSKMEVSFYLTVNVTWYNVTSGGLNNEPVSNASVTIYNVNDVPTNLSTDSNGIVYTKILALKLNKTTMPAGVAFMPHKVNVSKYDISNETEPFYVNKTRYVELVLYDPENPSMYINPVSFNITNKPSLTLTGTASDNIAVWKVEVSKDGTNWVIATGTTSWFCTVTLSEGLNTVYVKAKDFAGNNGTDSITITLDTTPPMLNIISPVTGIITNQSTIELVLQINGTHGEEIVLWINQFSTTVTLNTTFRKNLTLSEGENTFSIYAVDGMGNGNELKFITVVVFDNTPPTSGIAHINDYTNTLTTITGVVNDHINGAFSSGIKKVEICIIRESDNYNWSGSAWSSTEKWLTVEGTSTWSYSWTPKTDGVYTIKSRATDNANNTETPSSGVTFTYDKTPPTLTNIKPSNDTETELETVTVSGETDGVNVTVNGEYADVKDGKFSATVPLGSGDNTITIIAKDLAGNTNQATITVKKISAEWFPRATQWTVLLVGGVIVIALMIAVFVLYKKKIIKLKPQS